MATLTWNFNTQTGVTSFGSLNEELKEFLTDLTHLNENSATIGAGRLAQIKSEAAYLLNKLNKE